MHKITLDILLLEDSSSDAELIQIMLEDHDAFTANVHWVKCLSDASEAIALKSYSLIFSDLGLSDSQGTATISRLKSLAQQTPIIALTSEVSNAGIDTIRAGAHDFIAKNQLSKPLVSRTVQYTIERSQMIAELFAANQHLAKMYEMSQQFVDNVSHEFRTPLTVIKEFASIVKDGIDGPVTDKQKTRLTTLITRTNDLALMVDDLLDTSRLESGLLKACRKQHNLKSIISHVEKMLQTRAEAKKINLTMVDVADDLTVFCDEEKLRRILINLIVNAIKFTPAQGKVEILAEVSGRDRIKITVSDNGHGISSEDLELIFQRFQQAGEQVRMASCKGFGLGLSIARSLASLNLGNLDVSSEAGVGSQFSITLPIARTDAILNCYFDQREAAPVGDGDVSVIKILPSSYSPEDKEEVAEAIDDFLQSSTKHFDLTLQVNDGDWLLIACVCEELLPALLTRLDDLWQQVHRNHYGAELPELIFERLETLKLKNNRERLTQLIIGSPDASNAAPQDKTAATLNRKRLLIIDDEVEIVSAMEARFTASGFNVVSTFDGQAGVEAALAIQPDAILMDIRMPKIDGLRALEILKSDLSTANTPVIILSASLTDKKLALDRGARFFIQKPFDSESISSALKSIFSSQQVQHGQPLLSDERSHCDGQGDEIKAPNVSPSISKMIMGDVNSQIK